MQLDKPTLRIALKRYPQTAALLSGAVSSPLMDFEFHDIEPIHDAFKPMAQRQAFDVSEMAIFTCLQAFTYKKPIILLPLVLAARFQHPCIVYNTNYHKELTPEMLPGMKVGVRAYSQTTGAWVRNILSDEHDLDLESVRWITFEGGHLEQYREPDFVTRAPAGTRLLPSLMSGAVDAAILGNDLPNDPNIKAVIPNAASAGQAWFNRHGLVPINHMLVVTEKLANERPDLVRETFALFRASKGAAPPSQPDLKPIGCNNIRPSLELVIDLAYRQRLIPKRFEVDDLFASAREIIGEQFE